MIKDDVQKVLKIENSLEFQRRKCDSKLFLISSIYNRRAKILVFSQPPYLRSKNVHTNEQNERPSPDGPYFQPKKVHRTLDITKNACRRFVSGQ